MPTADRRRSRRARRLRCEGCLQVLWLRHAWDVAACGCGDLLLSGRPTRPTVHWLSRPGGGWAEVDDEGNAPVGTGDDQARGPTDRPTRRLGFPVAGGQGRQSV